MLAVLVRPLARSFASAVGGTLLSRAGHLVVAVLAGAVAPGWCASSNPAGQVVISGATPEGPLALAAYGYSAGAVCSLAWNNKQFIDAKDHGRCMQSAVSYDWLGENFNPTEAGSSMYTDGFMPAPSSSQILNFVASANKLHTQTQMAFWYPVSGQRLSNHIVRKYVQIGYLSLPNAIDYQVEFDEPANELHSIGQYEFLTGYMPLEFTNFYTYDPARGTVQTLSDGPGEQALPLVFATRDLKHAIGVWSPRDLVGAGGGYGRWRYTDTVKWNMVARVRNPVGTQRFRAFVVVGSFAQVQASLAYLVRNPPP